MKKKRNFSGLKAFMCSAVAMALSATIGSSVQAATFADTSGHWAETAIERWASYDVIAGYNGYFRPDDPITRGDMAVIINRIMDYQIESTRYYSDLDENYYTSPIRKLNSAGFMEGFDNTIRPKDYITREEAAVVIANAMHLDVRPTTDGTYETTFTDNYQIAYWAKNSIYMLNNLGALNGRSTNYFEPQVNITRAEVAYALDKLIEEFIYEKEGYSINSVNGTVVINEAGVSLENMTIAGNLILAEGIADGDIYLDNIVVKGNIIIKGGSTNTIYVDDVTCNGRMEVSRVDAATLVKMRGSSSIPVIDIYNDCTVDGSRLDYGNSLGDITIYPDAENVTILGNVDSLTNESLGCDITLGGNFGSVDMNQQGTVNDTSYSAGSKVDVSDIPATTADLAPGILINPVFPNSYASAFISVSDPTIDVETGDVELFIYVSSVANCDLMSVAKNAITITDGQDLDITVAEYDGGDETFGTTVYQVNFTVARNVETVELDVNFALISNAPDITIDKNFDEVDSTKNPSASVKITEIEEAEDGLITMTLIVSHMEDCRLPLDPAKAVTINPASGKDEDDYPEITVVEGYGSTTTLTAYQISFYPDEDQDTLPLQVNFLDSDSESDFSDVKVTVNMNLPSYDEDEDEEPTASYEIKSLIDDIDAGVTSFRLQITDMEHCELPDDDTLAITCHDEDDLSVVTMINTGTRRYFYISVPYDEDRTKIEIDVNFVDDVHIWDGDYLITSEGSNYDYLIQIDDSGAFQMHDGIKLDGGETVTITPSAGETIYSVQILSDNITKVNDLVQNSDGSWTFTMPTSDITLYVSNTNVTSTMKVYKGVNSADFDVYLVKDNSVVDVGVNTSFTAMQYVYITPEAGYIFSGVPTAVDASGNTVAMTKVDSYFYAIAPMTGDVTVSISAELDTAASYTITADRTAGYFDVKYPTPNGYYTTVNQNIAAGTTLYVYPDYTNGDIAVVYAKTRGTESLVGTVVSAATSITHVPTGDTEYRVVYFNSTDLDAAGYTASYKVYLQGLSGTNVIVPEIAFTPVSGGSMVEGAVTVDLNTLEGYDKDALRTSNVEIIYNPTTVNGYQITIPASINTYTDTLTFRFRGHVTGNAEVTFVVDFGDDGGQEELPGGTLTYADQAIVNGLAFGDNLPANMTTDETTNIITVNMNNAANYESETYIGYELVFEPDVTGVTSKDAKFEDGIFTVEIVGTPASVTKLTLVLNFKEEGANGFTVNLGDRIDSATDGDGNAVTDGGTVAEDGSITVFPKNPEKVATVTAVEKDGTRYPLDVNFDGESYTHSPVTGDVEFEVIYNYVVTFEAGLTVVLSTPLTSGAEVMEGSAITVTHGASVDAVYGNGTLLEPNDPNESVLTYSITLTEDLYLTLTQKKEEFTVSTFDGDPDFTVKVNGETKNLPMTVTADDAIQIVPTSGKVIDKVNATNATTTPTEENSWTFTVTGNCVVDVTYKTVLATNVIKVEEAAKETGSTATVSLHNVTTNNAITANTTTVTEGNLFSVSVDNTENQTYTLEVTDANGVVINPTSGSNIYTMPATAVTVTVTYKPLEDGQYSIHSNVTPTSVGGGYTLKVNGTATTENVATKGELVEVIVTEVPGYAWILTVTESTTNGTAVQLDSTSTGGTFTMPDSSVYVNIHYVEDFTVTYSDEVTVTGIQGYTGGPLKADISVDSDGTITGTIAAAELTSKNITQALSDAPLARTINPSTSGLVVGDMTAKKNTDGSITFNAKASGTLQSNAGVVFSLDFESAVTTHEAKLTFAFVDEDGDTVDGLSASAQSVANSGTISLNVTDISGYDIITVSADDTTVMTSVSADTGTDKIYLTYTLAALTQNEDVTVTFEVKEKDDDDDSQTGGKLTIGTVTLEFENLDSSTDSTEVVDASDVTLSGNNVTILTADYSEDYTIKGVVLDPNTNLAVFSQGLASEKITLALTNSIEEDTTVNIIVTLREKDPSNPVSEYNVTQGESSEDYTLQVEGTAIEGVESTVEAADAVVVTVVGKDGFTTVVTLTNTSDPTVTVPCGQSSDIEFYFTMPKHDVTIDVKYVEKSVVHEVRNTGTKDIDVNNTTLTAGDKRDVTAENNIVLTPSYDDSRFNSLTVNTVPVAMTTEALRNSYTIQGTAVEADGLTVIAATYQYLLTVEGEEDTGTSHTDGDYITEGTSVTIKYDETTQAVTVVGSAATDDGAGTVTFDMEAATVVTITDMVSLTVTANTAGVSSFIIESEDKGTAVSYSFFKDDRLTLAFGETSTAATDRIYQVTVTNTDTNVAETKYYKISDVVASNPIKLSDDFTFVNGESYTLVTEYYYAIDIVYSDDSDHNDTDDLPVINPPSECAELGLYYPEKALVTVVKPATLADYFMTFEVKDGDATEVTPNGDSFTMPADKATVTVTYKEIDKDADVIDVTKVYYTTDNGSNKTELDVVGDTITNSQTLVNFTLTTAAINSLANYQLDRTVGTNGVELKATSNNAASAYQIHSVVIGDTVSSAAIYLSPLADEDTPEEDSYVLIHLQEKDVNLGTVNWLSGTQNTSISTVVSAGAISIESKSNNEYEIVITNAQDLLRANLGSTAGEDAIFGLTSTNIPTVSFGSTEVTGVTTVWDDTDSGSVDNDLKITVTIADPSAINFAVDFTVTYGYKMEISVDSVTDGNTEYAYVYKSDAVTSKMSADTNKFVQVNDTVTIYAYQSDTTQKVVIDGYTGTLTPAAGSTIRHYTFSNIVVGTSDLELEIKLEDLNYNTHPENNSGDTQWNIAASMIPTVTDDGGAGDDLTGTAQAAQMALVQSSKDLIVKFTPSYSVAIGTDGKVYDPVVDNDVIEITTLVLTYTENSQQETLEFDFGTSPLKATLTNGVYSFTVDGTNAKYTDIKNLQTLFGTGGIDPTSVTSITFDVEYKEQVSVPVYITALTGDMVSVSASYSDDGTPVTTQNGVIIGREVTVMVVNKTFTRFDQYTDDGNGSTVTNYFTTNGTLSSTGTEEVEDALSEIELQVGAKGTAAGDYFTFTFTLKEGAEDFVSLSINIGVDAN